MPVQLRLTKETLNVEQVVGDGKAQKIVEAILDVPREKPDIEQVLKVDVEVKPHAKIRVIDDKVIVDGTLEFQTLYVADTEAGDQPVHHMEHTIKFTAYVDVEGAEECMEADVDVEIENVDWEVIEACKVRATVVLQITARVTDVQPVEVVTDAELVTTPVTPAPVSPVITG